MTLQQLDVLGTWVAGIATLLAVIVSLTLARKASSLRLRIFAGERMIVTSGEEETVDCTMISVTNCCPHPATITHISWKSGWFNSLYLVQLFNIPGYETLPKKLEQGGQASFIIPYNIRPEGEESWAASIAKSLLKNKKWPWFQIKTLKCVVSVSIGQEFKVSVEKGLKDRIYNAYLESKNN